MIKRLFKFLFFLLGASIGFAVNFLLTGLITDRFGDNLAMRLAILAASILLFGLIFYFLAPYFLILGQKIANAIDKYLSQRSGQDVLFIGIGLIIGLVIAALFSIILKDIPFVGPYLSILAYLFFGYISARVFVKRKNDILQVFYRTKTPPELKGFDLAPPEKFTSSKKVVDTSVIIDGRILDISKTGFIEGVLYIPNFVLKELQTIADSTDDMKRLKGRRGLDILNLMQKDESIRVEIIDQDYDSIQDVDEKLIKLAEEIQADILTNDFNLNKVAQFHGIKVLNINELANAVKPILISGEQLTVKIMKEGKEAKQGIAYLDDGTMIVVEGARKMLGQTITVSVTSILQTSAGRMVFAKLSA